MIPLEQRELCEKLYKDGSHTIKKIMSITGIRSEQTIYRILDEAGIPRRPTRPTEWRATISFDKETSDMIGEVRPRNLSAWVCKMIKEAYKR